MKKNLALIAAVLSTTMAASAEDLPWLNIEGQINFDATVNKSSDYESSLRTRDAEIKFEMLLNQSIKAVIKTELERALRVEGNNVASEKFDIEKFVEEAYIQIETDAWTKLPKATLIVGKQRMAFSEQMSKLPMAVDSQLYSLMNDEEMIGLTVKMPVNFMSMVDEISASLYETGAGDLEVDDHIAGTVRLSKKLTDKIAASVSGMIKEHEDENELRGAIGVVFDSGEGWTVYAQGVVTRNNPTFAEKNTFGALAGATKKMGPGTVVVEGSVLEDASSEEAENYELKAAYNMGFGQYLTLSPSVSYSRNSETKKDDVTLGVSARIQFEKAKKVNQLKKGSQI